MSKTALFYFLLFSTGILASLFSNPSYGVYTYILTYFFNPPQRWWWYTLPQLRFSFYIAIAAFIGYVTHSSEYQKNHFFDIPSMKWFILFIVLMIIMFPFAVNKGGHQRFLITVIKYGFLVFIIIKTIDNKKKYTRMIWCFLVGQFYIGWLAYSMGRGSDGRLENLGGPDSQDSNKAGAVICTAIPIMVDYLINGTRREKYAAFIFLVFTLNAIILINSRGTFLALLVSMAYYTLLSLQTPAFMKTNKFKLIFSSICAIVLFMYLTDSYFWTRMATIADKEDTGGGRIFFWTKTFDMLRDYPFGMGATGYQTMSPQYIPEEGLHPITHDRAVHSLYFQALAEYGYHGLFLVLTFFYSNMRYLKKLRKKCIQTKINAPYHHAISLQAAFISFMVSSVFISTLYMEILYWFSAFMGVYGRIGFKEIELATNPEIKTSKLNKDK